LLLRGSRKVENQPLNISIPPCILLINKIENKSGFFALNFQVNLLLAKVFVFPYFFADENLDEPLELSGLNINRLLFPLYILTSLQRRTKIFGASQCSNYTRAIKIVSVKRG
jgi:hypothetical protein